MNPMSELVEFIFHPLSYLYGTALMWLCIGGVWAVIGMVRLIASIFKDDSRVEQRRVTESLQEQFARNRRQGGK